MHGVHVVVDFNFRSECKQTNRSRDVTISRTATASSVHLHIPPKTMAIA